MIGSKYEETKHLDIKDIAKLVRQDIKKAVSSGQLAKAKYGVRIRRYAGGRSLDVAIKNFDFPLRGEDHLLTDVASATLQFVRNLVDAYNFDHSDSMTDYFHVRFYGSVDFDSSLRFSSVEG